MASLTKAAKGTENVDVVEEESQSKKSADFPIQFRALVRDMDAGSVIGKRGANIKRLRSEYEATILVPSTKSEERLLSIDASLDTVCRCLTDIFINLERHTAFKEEGRTNFPCGIHLLVDRSLCGRLIGAKGAKIKELKSSSGVSVLKVFNDTLPNSTERVVWVLGNLDAVIKAVESIFQYLKNYFIQGDSQLFDPEKNPVEQFGLSFGFFDNETLTETQAPFDDHLGGYKAPTHTTDLVTGNSNDKTKRKKFECTIPNNLVGFIIGQGGDRIGWIRARSKATINIAKAKPGCDESVTTLIGTEEEIEAAQYYLLRAAKEALEMDRGKSFSMDLFKDTVRDRNSSRTAPTDSGAYGDGSFGYNTMDGPSYGGTPMSDGFYGNQPTFGNSLMNNSMNSGRYMNSRRNNDPHMQF